jgi:hypothetical protein
MDYGGKYKLVRRDHGVVELVSKEPLTVLAIPDTHAPYQHPDTIRFLADVKKEFKPDVVIHLGDEVEFESLSVHGKTPDMPGAKDEYEAALESLGDMYRLFPDALVCHSNHTSRPYRVAHSAGLPSQMLKAYAEILQAPPGWSWHDRIIVNDVCYIHGDPKSGANATRAWMSDNRMSTVHGHVHGWGQVVYSQSPFKQIFGMNAGCLIDLQAMAFKYGSKYANKGTLGCGLIRGGKDAHLIKL